MKRNKKDSKLWIVVWILLAFLIIIIVGAGIIAISNPGNNSAGASDDGLVTINVDGNTVKLPSNYTYQSGNNSASVLVVGPDDHVVSIMSTASIEDYDSDYASTYELKSQEGVALIFSEEATAANVNEGLDGTSNSYFGWINGNGTKYIISGMNLDDLSYEEAMQNVFIYTKDIQTVNGFQTGTL